MAKTATIKLDEIEFVVPALNIAQLQDVAVVFNTGTPATNGFAVLKTIMQRATPQPDWDVLAPTLDEIGTAVQTVLKMSGMEKPANPQLAVVGGTETNS